MIYILDAYNVIHKIPYLAARLNKDLREAREALMTLCGQWAASRGDVTKIILVFDGRSEFEGQPQRSHPKIQWVFSQTGEAADERIVVLLEQLTGKKKCVVSDDNFVRNHARVYETSVMSVAEFDRLTHSGTGKKKTSSAPSKKSSLPPHLANEITRDYKKHLGLDE